MTRSVKPAPRGASKPDSNPAPSYATKPRAGGGASGARGGLYSELVRDVVKAAAEEVAKMGGPEHHDRVTGKLREYQSKAASSREAARKAIAQARARADDVAANLDSREVRVRRPGRGGSRRRGSARGVSAAFQPVLSTSPAHVSHPPTHPHPTPQLVAHAQRKYDAAIGEARKSAAALGDQLKTVVSRAKERHAKEMADVTRKFVADLERVLGSGRG